jgi:predicted nucleic acid-binding protein
MLIVPDASVILTLVLEREDEPDFPIAFHIIDDFLAGTIEIRLPSLWRYEVANTLAMKRSRMARDAMETLLAYEFEEESLHREYCIDVLRFMAEVRGISFYDASYHVLALREGGVYVTADQRYIGYAGGKGHVVLLSQWKTPTRRQ